MKGSLAGLYKLRIGDYRVIYQVLREEQIPADSRRWSSPGDLSEALTARRRQPVCFGFRAFVGISNFGLRYLLRQAVLRASSSSRLLTTYYSLLTYAAILPPARFCLLTFDF